MKMVPAMFHSLLTRVKSFKVSLWRRKNASSAGHKYIARSYIRCVEFQRPRTSSGMQSQLRSVSSQEWRKLAGVSEPTCVALADSRSLSSVMPLNGLLPSTLRDLCKPWITTLMIWVTHLIWSWSDPKQNLLFIRILRASSINYSALPQTTHQIRRFFDYRIVI